jgi:DMSO/TMAO reductase YedYZ heme-binding membrane subunit
MPCFRGEKNPVSNIPWHLRNFRKLIYWASAAVILGIAVVSATDGPDAEHGWIAARQLYGLWALALLLASMIPGPLTFVLLWIPFKGHLIMARRALGISSFVMAVSHAVCYLGPILAQNWDSVFAPGKLWVAGLIVGLISLAGLGILAITSGRRSIRSLGPRRWKQLHKMVYVLLPAALLHATFVGTDFGLNKGPDVHAEVDAGCLIAMLSISASWLILFVLRKKQIRWAPPLFQKSK